MENGTRENTITLHYIGGVVKTEPGGEQISLLVRGAGLVHAMPLDGTAWTVTAREGGATTCRAEDGREATAAIPEHAHVLRVLDPVRGE